MMHAKFARVGLSLSVAMLLLARGTAADETRETIPLAPFLERLQQIERDGGALDPRLSEQYLGLGLAHRANGDLADAQMALQQALHVNRINQGLHRLVHIPIIDLLIETGAADGNWALVDDQHELRYWIHRRELTDEASARVDAAVTFAKWQLRARELDTDVTTFSRLRDAINALTDAAVALTRDGSAGHPDLMPVLNAQAEAYRHLALYVSQSNEDLFTGGARVGEDYSDYLARKNLVIESIIRGRAALDHVISLTAGEPLAHGMAWANLGDWELGFDRPHAAAENYRRAWRELSTAGLTPDELAFEVSRPRPLGEFSLALRNRTEPPAAAPEAHVTASFTVTKHGKVRDIDVVSAAPAGNTRIVRRARSALRESRFRPRIGAEGPLEATTTIRYVFPDVAL